MRSPVAMSNGCAPVLASYSAITSFTSSMLAVAGSYSRSVVSPRDENVRILAFMVGLLLTFRFPLRGALMQSLSTTKGPAEYSHPRTDRAVGAFMPFSFLGSEH